MFNINKTEEEPVPQTMRSKNSGQTCESKYCPVGSNEDTLLVPSDPILIDKSRYYAPVRKMEHVVNPDDVYRSEIRNRYQKNIVAGGAEASKIKLIIVLQKLQEMGVEYSLLSQYFQDSFKKETRAGNIDVIESILVFDKTELLDSNDCYARALAGIKKTRTTDYSIVAETINGLVDILKMF